MKRFASHLPALVNVTLLMAALLLTGRLASAADLSPITQEQVERIVVTEMARRGIPGLTIAIGVGNGPIWSRGYGFADLENFVPATERSVYRLASIAKPITAVALLQQAEVGRLKLDDDVRVYVSAFPKKRWPTTLRQLLGHLGGIRSYRGKETESTKFYANVPDGLEMFAADPLEHQPGTKYLYSSYGFNLAGAATEAAAGVPFRNLLNSRIFTPAGMLNTRDDSHFTLIRNRVEGYRKGKNGDLENSALADTSNKVPGGGLVATAADLVRFGQALLDGKLLSEKSRKLMWTSQSTSDGKATGYGMGWHVENNGGKLRVSHGGAQPGTSTYLDMAPEERIVVAILTNLEGAGPKEISRQVMDALRGGSEILPTREQ